MISLIHAWLDAIFPPLCAICKGKADIKCFCFSCWTKCAPPDPEERCPHCFHESEGLCKECKKGPRLSFSRAAIFDADPSAHYLARKRADLLVDFATLQWAQLDWPLPDAIVPMHGAKNLARDFAERIDCPFAPILKRGGWCDVEAIEEDQVFLLIANENSVGEVREAISLLQETFPKKGFLLSLFPLSEDERNHHGGGEAPRPNKK